jgi:hypothetical protein
MITDGAVVDAGGRVVAILSKTIALPHLGVAIALRGSLQMLTHLPLFGLAPDLAGLQERALSTVRAVDGDAEVYVAGIDVCFAVTALGVVEVIETGSFALTPTNDAIYRELDFLDERAADKVDPEVDGLRVMDVLRRNPVQYQKGGAGIGGFVQLTSVTNAGLTTRILRRWPDHIGAPISR